MSQRKSRAGGSTAAKRNDINSGLTNDVDDTILPAENQFLHLNNIPARRRDLSDRLEAIGHAIDNAKTTGEDTGLLLADWMDIHTALSDLNKSEYRTRYTVPETLAYIAKIGARLCVDSDGALIVEPPDVPGDLGAAITAHGVQLIRYVSAFPDQTWPV